MRPLLSEFSFAYALTEELVTGALGGVSGFPVFPSLYQEGQPGGGYDVYLPIDGAPMYLQFKLSDCMVYRSAAEWDEFNNSYYRLHLRPRRHSDQHRMLCDLESAGNEVYYVAPYFHTADELNMFYAFHTVAGNSVWFNPLGIGYLADDKDHYVAFDRALPHGLFCSEDPRPTKTKFEQEAVGDRVRDYVERKKAPINHGFFSQIVENILDLAAQDRQALAYLRTEEFFRERRITVTQEAQFAAFLSRTLLDAELLILASPEE